MKSRELKKNLSQSAHPKFVYLVDNDGERQKHFVDSSEDWKAIQDICELMKLQIVMPKGDE